MSDTNRAGEQDTSPSRVQNLIQDIRSLSSMDLEKVCQLVHNIKNQTHVVSDRHRLGRAEIDSQSQQLFHEGRSCGLSPTEYKILSVLSFNPGQTVSRLELKHSIWGENFAIADRSIDSHVSRLRSKIKNTGILIQSRMNKGYVLNLE